MRRNERTFGRVPALGAWGHNGDKVNLNMEVSQVRGPRRALSEGSARTLLVRPP